MRGGILLLAAGLLAVAVQPALAQGKPSGKPAPPEKVGGKTLKQWIDLVLEPRDPSRREAAIRMVPYFGKASGAAVPALLNILENDRDASCRVNVCLTLYSIAGYISDAEMPRVVRVLSERLGEGEPQAIVRFHAAIAVGALGPKAVAAIPSLIGRIEDPHSWELRRAAVAALSAIAVDRKFGPDARAVTAVANSLLNTDSPERSGQVRLEAVMALGDMGRPGGKEYDLAVQALQKSLHDPDKPVQIWAAAALMRLDKATPEKLSELARNLKVKDANTKFHAARALLALREDARPHIPDIAELLNDKDPIVVATAIEVLAGFGSDAKATVPRLQQILSQKEQTDYFRQAARAAIKQITGTEPPAEKDAGTASGGSPSKPYEGPPDEIGGKNLKQWLDDLKSPDPSVRETAVKALPYFGKPAKAAVPALISMLKGTDRRYDADASCRCYACVALSLLAGAGLVEDSADAVKALGERVDYDKQAIVRYYAVIALGTLGTKASPAIPSLVNRIRDPHSWELRRAVIGALGQVATDERFGGDPRAVAAVASLLLNGDSPEKSSEVRMEAVMALGSFGRPVSQKEFLMSLHALQRAVGDTDKGVAIWARVALMAVDKVTKEGLDEVTKYLVGPKATDVAAKVQAIRALGAMGKEAKAKIPDITKALDDADPMVIGTAIEVLRDFGPLAQDALPALQRVAEKKGQTDMFKQLAKSAIDKISAGNPKR